MPSRLGRPDGPRTSRLLLLAPFVVALSSCSSDDDFDEALGRPQDAPDDLSGELIGAGDLDGEWESRDGPAAGEPLDGSTPSSARVPTALPWNLSAEVLAQSERRSASIEPESLETFDDKVFELLHHDPSGELFDAFREVLDACVARTWEQGDDPVENVKLESVELDGVGDERVAYRERWGSGGEYYGTDLVAFVRTRGVLMLLTVRKEDVDGSGDERFRAAVTAAAARLEDGTWSPGVL